MTLTEADVARIRERVGHGDFFFVNEDEDYQLVNRDGACCFLEDGLCAVYSDRPDGCITYPFVLDVGRDVVALDTGCPGCFDFELTPAIESHLRRSVAEEARESRRRLRAHGKGDRRAR